MSTISDEVRVKPTQGTAASWTATNFVLLAGETGYETDTGYYKKGDGSTGWNSLSYFKPDGSKKSYDSGWIVITAWSTGATITITHNMSLSFENYHKKLLIRDPTSPTTLYNGEFTLFTSGMFGQVLNRSLDTNSIEIQIGNLGTQYLQTSGVQAGIPLTWEYKLILKEM